MMQGDNVPYAFSQATVDQPPIAPTPTIHKSHTNHNQGCSTQNQEFRAAIAMYCDQKQWVLNR